MSHLFYDILMYIVVVVVVVDANLQENKMQTVVKLNVHLTQMMMIVEM
jgi:hypothetical protein